MAMMPGPLPRYVGIAVLCAFYGVVWSLALNPRVDRLYRSYYIEKSLPQWPADRQLTYRPGTLIDFSKVNPYLSRRGWSEPETSGTWMIEQKAELFVVPDSVSEGDMELWIQASAFVPVLHRRTTVEISLNERTLGRRVFRQHDRRQDFRMAVPAEALDASPTLLGRKVIRIGFEVLDPGPPARSRFSVGRKMLGLHLYSLCLADTTHRCERADE